MYLQWTAHAKERAAERFAIPDVHLAIPLVREAWDRGEEWWERDLRKRDFDVTPDAPRGITRNWVVPFTWQGATVFAVTRLCDLDDQRHWVVSVLTHDQYLNNRKRMWKRSREALLRSSREPIRSYPFENLTLEKPDE